MKPNPSVFHAHTSKTGPAIIRSLEPRNLDEVSDRNSANLSFSTWPVQCWPSSPSSHHKTFPHNICSKGCVAQKPFFDR